MAGAAGFELPGVARIANGALPKTGEGRRNVQIPGEAPERLRIGWWAAEVGWGGIGAHALPVEQGHAVASDEIVNQFALRASYEHATGWSDIGRVVKGQHDLFVVCASLV
jgi:hypothetical protein